jgi:hypothetical protein
VATGRDGAKTGSSVAERWDAWTCSEVMAARGHEVAPGWAAFVGRSDMTTDDCLEAANARVPVNGKPSALTALVARRHGGVADRASGCLEPRGAAGEDRHRGPRNGSAAGGPSRGGAGLHVVVRGGAQPRVRRGAVLHVQPVRSKVDDRYKAGSNAFDKAIERVLDAAHYLPPREECDCTSRVLTNTKIPFTYQGVIERGHPYVGPASVTVNVAHEPEVRLGSGGGLPRLSEGVVDVVNDRLI